MNNMIFKKLEEAKNFKLSLIKAKLITTEGSVPRNKGTFMLISNTNIYGSIGGGQLEYNIINRSKIILKKKKDFKEEIINIPLGPSIGQCCGGYAQIKLTKYKNGTESLNDEENIEKNLDNLFIFGAGHIGKELSKKSIDLDFKIHLIDSRADYFKEQKNDGIINIYAKFPWMIIKNLPKNSYYIILTHSHDFDFKIISEILKINNFNFIGLIGSKTKRKRFENRLLKLGFNKFLIDKIECPIGIRSIEGKEPDVIAISIIARLLEYRSLNISNIKEEPEIMNKSNE